MASTKIDAIQGLRGIAALLVVVDHSILQLTAGAHGTAVGAEIVRKSSDVGTYGVEIFFLISGFIMTVTTHNEFSVEALRANCAPLLARYHPSHPHALAAAHAS